MTTVNVFNGPNLGRLGRRETQVYGSTTHDDLVAMIEREAVDLGLRQGRPEPIDARALGWQLEDREGVAAHVEPPRRKSRRGAQAGHLG